MSCLLTNPTYSEEKRSGPGGKGKYVPMSIIKKREGSGRSLVTYEQDANDKKWATEMEICNQERNDVRKVSLANLVCSAAVLFLVCRFGDLFEIARNISAISRAND